MEYSNFNLQVNRSENPMVPVPTKPVEMLERLRGSLLSQFALFFSHSGVLLATIMDLVFRVTL